MNSSGRVSVGRYRNNNSLRAVHYTIKTECLCAGLITRVPQGANILPFCHLLLHQEWFYFSGIGLSRLSWKLENKCLHMHCVQVNTDQITIV